MAQFRWIEWNLDKVAAHSLTYEDVEHAFEHRLGPHQERRDGSYETIGTTPSGLRSRDSDRLAIRRGVRFAGGYRDH